jgi:hypothetical protein
MAATNKCLAEVNKSGGEAEAIMAMLAEIYLLKLEAAVRAAKEAATTASTSRFVPVTFPAGKAS